MLERLAAAVVRHRAAVLAVWLVVLGVGIWSAIRLPGLLTGSFAVPGSDSDRANTILARHFGERPEGTFTVVFRVRNPADRGVRAELRARLTRAARAVPTGQARELRAGAGVLYGELATSLDLQHAKRYADDLRRALHTTRGPPALVSGQPAIQHDLDPILSSDVRRGEAIALPVALLVLIGVFGFSLAVAVPFAVAACTIAATLAAVSAFAEVTAVVSYVPNLVTLIGLGLAIDYSLLVVHRFREELAGCREVTEAVVTTTATAGRAVVFSGLTVAIGLGALLLVPVPFIRSMGLGGFLIPLVSIAAALTLQPALLSFLGTRAARARADRGWWTRLASAVMRRPLTYLAAGATLLLAATLPVFWLHLTPGSISGLPHSPESVRGYELLRGRVGPGIVTPTYVVVDAGAPGAARRPAVRRAVARLADRLVDVPEAYVIANGPGAPYVDSTGRYVRLVVAGRHEYGDPATRRFVDRLRRTEIPAAGFPAGARVYAGGIPPQGVDFLGRTYGAFPWLVVGVLALTYAALFRAFRSLFLPLKAVVLNLLSVGAGYGLLVVVFRWGVGSGLLGLHRTDQVEAWIPVFLFAVLFGLSMDYEVFMVSRMREAWDETRDNTHAVAAGLERTGQIVTAAALIMVAAFSGFVAGRVPGLQELGLGLALAVLIDATLIRIVLVPSAMAVLGRWNWWLPGGRR